MSGKPIGLAYFVSYHIFNLKITGYRNCSIFISVKAIIEMLESSEGQGLHPVRRESSPLQNLLIRKQTAFRRIRIVQYSFHVAEWAISCLLTSLLIRNLIQLLKCLCSICRLSAFSFILNVCIYMKNLPRLKIQTTFLKMPLRQNPLSMDLQMKSQ